MRSSDLIPVHSWFDRGAGRDHKPSEIKTEERADQYSTRFLHAGRTRTEAKHFYSILAYWPELGRPLAVLQFFCFSDLDELLAECPLPITGE